MLERSRQRIGLPAATMAFELATGYFYLLLHTLYPFLRTRWSVNTAVHRFVTGYFSDRAAERSGCIASGEPARIYQARTMVYKRGRKSAERKNSD